jgi:hypothetical protein
MAFSAELKKKPHGLHFSGHGEKGFLLLEDHLCGSKIFSEGDLKTLL